jgi:hypothetical protein
VKLIGSKKKIKPTKAERRKLLVLVTIVGWILVVDKLNAFE